MALPESHPADPELWKSTPRPLTELPAVLPKHTLRFNKSHRTSRSQRKGPPNPTRSAAPLARDRPGTLRCAQRPPAPAETLSLG